MKKLVIIFVFCLFSLVSYSQVITVYKNSIKYEVENYDSTTLKLDSIKAIISSNHNIEWVIFDNGTLGKAIKSKDVLKMDRTNILSIIKNNKKSKPSYSSSSTSYPSSSTSYYRDYRTGYTIESHTNSHGGNAIIRDASGRIISTTNMSW